MTQAQTPPTETKLLGRATTPQAGNQFGTAVAISDRFLLVGEPYNDDKGTNAGAAHLFDTRTCRYLRKLIAKDAAMNDYFGQSVALSGNLAVVGAYGDDDKGSSSGSAYVFDVRTGAQLRKLTPDEGSTDDNFGYSVALSGDLALIGALNDDVSGSNSGSAYVFHARTGAQLRKLTPADGAAQDLFGSSMSLSGHLALIGAPEDDDTGINSGSAYVFDVRTGALVRKLTATDGAAGNRFGGSVALSGNLALIGAYGDALTEIGTSTGSAYILDARSGTQLRKLTASDAAAGDFFGFSVALSGNLALIGAYGDEDKGPYSGSAYVFDARTGTQFQKLTADEGAGFDDFGKHVALSGGLALIGAAGDDDNGGDSGSVYVFRPLAEVPTLSTIAAKGALAPGPGSTSFRDFSKAYLNPSNRTFLTASLSGPGTGSGHNMGAFNNLSGLNLAVRTRETDLSGLKAASLLNTWSNYTGSALVSLNLTGPGVTAFNKQALYRHQAPSNLLPLARGGLMLPAFMDDAAVQSLVEVVASGQDRIAIRANLRRKSGGPTTKNDSAILFVNHAGGLIGQVFREQSRGIVGGGTLGQLFSRVAESRGNVFFAFGASVIPVTGPAYTAVLFAPYNSSFDVNIPAYQGKVAPGTTANYRSFLGESESSNGYSLWRASLTGSGVNTSNNEGVWIEGGTLLARKGQEIEPGVKITRFLQFWPVNANNQLVTLVRLAGRGVTSGNDVALCLWDRVTPGHVQVLLREGQYVEGNDAPKIRSIQRVDVAPELNGHYVVLCSLTGASTQNQALFTGQTVLGSFAANDIAKRLPGMRLRKGTLQQLSLSDFSRISSINLSPTTDKTGAGGKGLGQVINNSGVTTQIVTYSNRLKRVVTGVP